jgi:magnesium transporter
MIKAFLITKKQTKQISEKEIKKFFSKKSSTLWIDIENPKEKDYDLLKNVFKFHDLTIEDCRKLNELPKVDIYEKYLFGVIHSYEFDEKKNLKRNEVDFFLGENYFVTVHRKRSHSLNMLIKKLESAQGLFFKSPDFLMHELIDRKVDNFFPLIDNFEDMSEELEQEILSSKKSKNYLKEIFSLKKKVLSLRKSIAPQRDVINKLTKTEMPFIKEKTRVYLKDVYDHILRVHSEVESVREMLINTFEAYSLQLSNETNLTSNRMNEVMKKLTVVATIFMPLTFITGVYGMNFKYMPELYWQYGYFLILGIMIFVAIFMLVMFKRKKLM